MKRLYRAIRLKWRLRKLKRAWKVIGDTELFMIGKSSQKRQQFWHDFIYHKDFRHFAKNKIVQEILR